MPTRRRPVARKAPRSPDYPMVEGTWAYSLKGVPADTATAYQRICDERHVSVRVQTIRLIEAFVRQHGDPQ